MKSRRPAIVLLSGFILASGLVALFVLGYLPLARKGNESVSANAPAQPPRRQRPSAPSTAAPPAKQAASKAPPAQSPADESKPVDKSAAAKANKKVVGEGDSAPALEAAKPGEPLGIAADAPKERRPEEKQGMIADAPPKSEPLGVPQGPKQAVVADTPKGLYQERTKPKTAEWLDERGGTMESQKAVEDGLNWLARHQGEDGHWGADCLGMGPSSRCNPNAPCQGTGLAYEIAQSGLALLAFQAAGHYYFNGQKYSDQVKKGLDYLVEEQAPDGSIVGSQNPSPQQISAGAHFDKYFMYEHAMGTFALCEACAVAIAEKKKPEPKYQTAAARAVYFIESVQHNDGGWRYTVNPRDESDCSISGWVMLALKTAREAQVHVSPEVVGRMMKFFAAHFVEDGQTYYQPGNPGTDAMTGVGMMAVEFFEHKLDSPIVQGGAAYLSRQVDAPDLLLTSNYYLWYNCTMAMFQVGGQPWERWNGAVRDRVTGLQVRGEGCDRGSWPPYSRYGGLGGRVYTTSLAVLTLEVYYRFQRIAGEPEKAKFFEK